MGVVFRAREVRLDGGRHQAPAADVAAGPTSVSASCASAHRAQLYHPNIVPILLADEVDGLIFFVMACVDGETLADRVRRTGPMARTKPRRCSAPSPGHSRMPIARGVVLRDIKPDNILIDRRAAAAGCGLRHRAGERIPGSTMAGEVVGTPEFMSPEQCAGTTSIAERPLFAGDHRLLCPHGILR
jgi:serine/threonine-protein kinase